MQRMIAFLCLSMLFIPAGMAQSQQEVFSLQFTLDRDGTASDILADTTIDTVSVPEGSGNYSIRLVTADTQTLFEADIAISFTRNLITGGRETVNETQVRLRIPYHRNATALHLYHQETVMSRISLTGALCQQDGLCRSYCDGKGIDIDCSCGDGTCQDHEGPQSCPQDCAEDFQEDEDTNESEPTDTDDEPDEPVNPGIGGDNDGQRPLTSYIIGAIALLIGIGLLIWFVREVET